MTGNSEQAAALAIQVIDDEYWIVNHEPTIGPYEFKKDAQSDLEGVRRFYKLCASENTPAENELEFLLS